MATTITPVTSIPTTSGSISGQFTAGAPMIRLSAALLAPGDDTLTLLRQLASGYWTATQYQVQLARSPSGFANAAASVDIPVNDTANYHVLSAGGLPAASESVTLEDLAPSTSIALPAISGDTIALLDASQVFTNKTLTAPIISTGLTASGSASNDFSGSTGTFKTSTGAVTIGGGAAAISATSSAGAITLTAGAASTWKTTSGALGVQGAAGVNLQYGATTLLDVGATASTAVTLAANKDLVGAAGTGALTLGSMTGATTLPTGNLTWAGASTKAASLTTSGAGSSITLTAGAASTWSTSAGALTLTSAAAATWSTAAGALTVSGAGGVNLQYNGGTLLDVGVTSSTKVTLAANIDLSAAAGTTALSLGSATGATALPTGNLAWTGASTKTLSLVSTGAGSSMTITAGAASTWKTSSGALTVDSATALNLGTSDSTSQSIGKSGTIATFNGKVAYGATAALIADPGNAGAIAVTADGVCALTSAGAETRTLAIPTFVGQRITLIMDTDGGDIVVTVASAYDQSAHTTITFNDAGDAVDLVGGTIGGTRAWRLVANLGTTLG